MSIDMFFTSCQAGQGTQESTNPFTGETETMDVGGICSDSERAAIGKLFASAGNNVNGGDGVIKFSDGNSVDCDFVGLDENPQFNGGRLGFQKITPDLAQFMYDLAVCGNFSIVGTSMEDPAIVTSEDATSQIPDVFSTAIVIKSGDDLYDYLAGELKDAENYIRRVIDEAED